MKRILITGGAGFIGSALYTHFVKSGNEVFVIDDLSFGSRSFIDIDDSHFFEINILDASAIDTAIKTIDPQWIIHLAAVHFIPWCNEHPFEASRINIQGTLNVLHASRQGGSLKKVLFASTAAVYPIHDEAVNEELPTGPMDIYGISKLAGEHICHEFHLESGIPVAICRFFNAFGPNETNPHLIPEIHNQIQEGKRSIQLGNLTPKRDFIHTSDMATGINAILDLDLNYDTFNLGRGIEYSVTEVVDAFSRMLDEEIKIEVDAARVRKVERMHLLADVSKLKQATGWEPKWDLDEGIKSLLES